MRSSCIVLVALTLHLCYLLCFSVMHVVACCSAFGCPYSAVNKDKEWLLADRLSSRSEPDTGYLSVKGTKHSYGRYSPEMKLVVLLHSG